MHELSVGHLKLPYYEHLQQRTFIVLPVLCLSSPDLLLVLLYSVHEGPPSILCPHRNWSLCVDPVSPQSSPAISHNFHVAHFYSPVTLC